jgi:hypothetical protein
MRKVAVSDQYRGLNILKVDSTARYRQPSLPSVYGTQRYRGPTSGNSCAGLALGWKGSNGWVSKCDKSKCDKSKGDKSKDNRGALSYVGNWWELDSVAVYVSSKRYAPKMGRGRLW